MADLALTAASIAVVDPDKAVIDAYIATETITAGQFLYGVVATGKVGLADEDAAETSFVLGMALNGAVAGQAVDVLRRGKVYGFTLAGHAYWLPFSLSGTAGALRDDVQTNVVARVVPLSDAALTKVLLVECNLGIIANSA